MDSLPPIPDEINDEIMNELGCLTEDILNPGWEDSTHRSVFFLTIVTSGEGIGRWTRFIGNMSLESTISVVEAQLQRLKQDRDREPYPLS